MTEFDRRSGIGGSDVGPILGISPWRTRLDVWMEKVGHPGYRPKPVSPEMRFGTLLEPVLRAAYEEDTGHRVTAPGDKTYWAEDRIRYAHLDGIVVPEGIWEGKVPFQTWRNWTEDGPPVYVLSQVQHYLDITGEPWCDVSALAVGLDPLFRTWRVDADPEAQANIRTAVTRFWNRNVLEGTPPEELPMNLEYPRHKSDLLVVADERAEELVRLIRSAQSQEANEAEYIAELKEELKGLIGTAAGMKGDGWRIRWKKNKDSEKVEWKHVASAYRRLLDSIRAELEEDRFPGDVLRLLTDTDPDAIVSLYTTVSEGARPFVLEDYDK